MDIVAARWFYDNILTSTTLAVFRRRVLPRNVDVYPSLNDNTGSNDDFYEAMCKYIEGAQSTIWIIGEGPQKPRAQAGREIDYAKVWSNAFIKNDSLLVHRIQTTRDMKSEEWKNHLSFLLDQFNGRFKLYFAATNVAYSAVFDAHSPAHCVTETMLPAVYDGTEIAGFGVFVSKNHERLAQPMQRKMKELIKGAIPMRALVCLMRMALESQKLSQIATNSNSVLSTPHDVALSIGRTTTVQITSSSDLENYLAIFASDSPKSLSNRLEDCK